MNRQLHRKCEPSTDETFSDQIESTTNIDFCNRYFNKSDILKSQNLLGIIISRKKFFTEVPNSQSQNSKRNKRKKKQKTKSGTKDNGKWWKFNLYSLQIPFIRFKTLKLFQLGSMSKQNAFVYYWEFIQLILTSARFKWIEIDSHIGGSFNLTFRKYLGIGKIAQWHLD